MNFEILFNTLNIIETQKEYSLQTGGYDELKNNQIIELWQNPDFNEKFINFYTMVNKYLRGIQINVDEKMLKILKLNSKKDFFDFMIYYINKLTNIIYKNPSSKTEIFFRGEFRKNFNYEIGNILFYSTFQAVSQSISTAFKFSQGTSKNVNLLFVIEIPKDFYYKILTTKMKSHNYKEKTTQYIDEKEILIMPNSYYIVVDKFTIYNNTNVIKIRLIHQEYYQIRNNELYKEDNYIPDYKTLKNNKKFNSKELTNFINLSKKYKKMIDFLNLLDAYKTSMDFYKILNDSNLNNLFNIDIDEIIKKVSLINGYNFREIANEIKTMGIGYYNYHLTKINEYKERINTIKLLINIDYNTINKLNVYAGFYNYDTSYKIPKFIDLLKKQKINKEFIYDKILRTRYNSDIYLYDDIYNLDKPNNKIKKNNKTSLLYYKYLIKFNIYQTKICVCNIHEYKNDDNIILIPNFKMKIINIQKLMNKYNLEYYYYEIELTNI